jgi:GTP-binding protein
MKAPVFKDKVRIRVTAGNGGNGSAAFRREKYIEFGGPSGGDGGNGGSVILLGDNDTNSLLDLYYQPLHRAEHGEPGRNKDRHGRCGRDLLIKVPCGTVVRDANTEEVLGEITEHGQRLLVAQGGKRGLGNLHYKTSTNRAPRKFTLGAEGEDRELTLELKIISQIGLVGYPNAGKSTLISKLTHAHPKVAAYPFTTLNPVIGTIDYPDFRKLRVADIPGLIEGAHAGVGLGHDFLRHIERTEFLVFVIDMGGVDGRDPVADYRSLLRELKLYQPGLEKRPSLIVANKMDLPAAEANLKDFIRRTRKQPLVMSAELEEGVAELKLALHQRFFGKPARVRRVRP